MNKKKYPWKGPKVRTNPLLPVHELISAMGFISGLANAASNFFDIHPPDQEVTEDVDFEIVEPKMLEDGKDH